MDISQMFQIDTARHPGQWFECLISIRSQVQSYGHRRNETHCTESSGKTGQLSRQPLDPCVVSNASQHARSVFHIRSRSLLSN